MGNSTSVFQKIHEHCEYTPRRILVVAPNSKKAADAQATVRKSSQQEIRAGGGAGAVEQPDDCVVSIVCGAHHNVLLTNKGSVYTFGLGEQGQLGHGDIENQYTPKKIKPLSDQEVFVKEAACGWGQTLLLGEKRTSFLSADVLTYGMGDGSVGQIGFQDTLDRKIPTLMPAMQMQNVTTIGCGNTHSLFVKDQITLWGCGETRGDFKTPQQVGPQPIEMKLQGNAPIKIASVTGGPNTTFIITSDGVVWNFGLGDTGQLGHGDDKPLVAPRKMADLMCVRPRVCSNVCAATRPDSNPPGEPSLQYPHRHPHHHTLTCTHPRLHASPAAL